jgi:hypothetical protein
MSNDKREDILARLAEILTSIAASGVHVYRNRAELDDSELPAYVLLDGNEQKESKALGSADRRAPQMMLLTPQIFYVPTPPTTQLNEGIGPLLSEHRITLLRGILQDDTLQNLLGSNGYVEYRGMETDMQTGAEVKGQFRLDLALSYVFNFSKL